MGNDGVDGDSGDRKVFVILGVIDEIDAVDVIWGLGWGLGADGGMNLPFTLVGRR